MAQVQLILQLLSFCGSSNCAIHLFAFISSHRYALWVELLVTNDLLLHCRKELYIGLGKPVEVLLLFALLSFFGCHCFFLIDWLNQFELEIALVFCQGLDGVFRQGLSSIIHRRQFEGLDYKINGLAFHEGYLCICPIRVGAIGGRVISLVVWFFCLN